ncbi:transmembrane protein C1orf162 homolog [Rhynchocyon petersi]
MGGIRSTPTPEIDKQGTHSTPAPPTHSAPCLLASPNKEILHLILAFLAGALLTLLLMAFIFLIIKSYRKCHSSPQALDPHSDHPTKLSAIPEDAPTYASMSFKTSEANSNHLTENHFADLDPVVYAEIK